MNSKRRDGRSTRDGELFLSILGIIMYAIMTFLGGGGVAVDRPAFADFSPFKALKINIILIRKSVVIVERRGPRAKRNSRLLLAPSHMQRTCSWRKPRKLIIERGGAWGSSIELYVCMVWVCCLRSFGWSVNHPSHVFNESLAHKNWTTINPTTLCLSQHVYNQNNAFHMWPTHNAHHSGASILAWQ